MNGRSLVVRKRMVEAGLGTARELADKADLSESVVAQWIGGKRVRPQTFKAIAEALELTVEELSALLDSAPQLRAG